MPDRQMTRVVLAEDGVLLREGLSGLLTRFDFEVVAAVGDAEALLAAAREHRPHLVVTDVRMPPTYTDEGLRAATTLRREQPALAVVALSQYVERSYATELLAPGPGSTAAPAAAPGPAPGGVGYLLKDRVVDVADFAATLRQVVNGGTVVDPEVVRRLLHRHRDPLARLSNREREVLARVAEGHSNAAIARLLVVSEAAVVKHVGNIFAKLDLPPTDDTNRRVLAVLAHLGHG